MLKQFLNLLFPQKCIECKKEEGLLCQSCYQKIYFSPYLFEIENKLPVYLAMRKSLLLKKMVHRFKYDFKEEIGDLFGTFLLKTLITFKNDFSNTIFVPIPIHYSKKFSRGFNQTELLSNYLSKKTKALSVNLLFRTKCGLVQAGLSREERFNNVKDIFTINQSVFVPTYISKEIILIDDIVTTGATLENASLVLKKQGFKKIEALAICHGL